MSNIGFFSKWHWKQPEKHVSINVINAIELKKDSTYILLADQSSMTKHDLNELIQTIKKQGIKNVVGFMLSGSPDDSVHLIDTKKPKGKKSYATNQARH